MNWVPIVLLVAKWKIFFHYFGKYLTPEKLVHMFLQNIKWFVFFARKVIFFYFNSFLSPVLPLRLNFYGFCNFTKWKSKFTLFLITWSVLSTYTFIFQHQLIWYRYLLIYGNKCLRSAKNGAILEFQRQNFRTFPSTIRCYFYHNRDKHVQSAHLSPKCSEREDTKQLLLTKFMKCSFLFTTFFNSHSFKKF